ncbi:helix-turn-helix transcriptional regulator [Staphylococcus equorum]|uniref:helix-turn-helix domain-containing protein n=1 Tax=Staphylococcus equorum TaxID=246432 RepID=UPI003D808931
MSLKMVIQDYKRDHELTYRNLAERTTVSKRTLEAYGNGEKRTINYTTAKKLCRGLDIELELLEEFIR